LAPWLLLLFEINDVVGYTGNDSQTEKERKRKEKRIGDLSIKDYNKQLECPPLHMRS
jgi:hypothetical protein